MFAMSVAYCDSFPLLQVGINIMVSLVVLIFMAMQKQNPFLSKSSLKFEIYNEVTIIMICYMQILLTDIIDDIEMRY